MSLILLLMGTFSGLLAALPRPGQWMVTIEKTMGVLMLALAEYDFIRAGILAV